MRILIIRFSSLGDCVLLVPLAAHLKSRGAEEVVVVTKNAYAEIFAAARGVDRVLGYDPGTGLAGLRRIAAANRGRGYSVVDAHNNIRSRLLSTFLGGASARLRKHYRQRLGLILFKKRPRLPTMLEQYGTLAEGVGFPAVRLTPGGLVITETSAANARQKLPGEEKNHVAVAPGSKWPTKRWPAEKYAELSKRIVDRLGRTVVLLGDKDDREIASRVRTAVGDGCVDLTGQTSVLETAGYLARCSALVGNDSGLVHVAEAVGVPVVAIFGPTVEAFGYFPALPGSKVIEHDSPCRPCSRNGGRPCYKGTLECLARIDVDTVESALMEVLNNPKALSS